MPDGGLGGSGVVVRVTVRSDGARFVGSSGRFS